MICDIVNGSWNKDHVIEAVRYIARNRPALPAGKYAYEFGTYRGESLRLIGEQFYGHQIHLEKAFGFDSFEGLPDEAPGVERFYLFNRGVFADVDTSQLWHGRNAQYIKCWFSDLKPEHVTRYGMGPAALVHIDGDLFVSAQQALKFMFENHLIAPGTIVCYDEFKSTDSLDAGGESLAHKQAAIKYDVKFREFFRNVYFDSVEKRFPCWQNAFVVESIGGESHHGIYGVE